MDYTPLLWQLPAIFTAVPMVARLLPVKIPPRAVPLLYVVVSLVVMALPGRVCLALGAAGLVSMIHVRLGENLSATEPPDMTEVANKLALAWDYIVTHLPILPVHRRQVSVSHDTPEDASPEDDVIPYDEPPRPPEARITQRIPHLD